MPPILYLIDGHALAYRTYFAITGGTGSDRLQTRSGEPTAGVYGFAMALLRLLEQEQPEYLAVAFDTGKTFRDDIYPQYKATRAKMPDDLRPQIERIRQMVDAFGFPRLEMEGFEADDVLGSIARQAAKQGFGIKIITGDRDLLQLVDDRTIVILPGKSLADLVSYTPEKVVESLGVRPDQVIEYKGLVGDHSDNIPGVPGVGEKTAVGLLEKYPNLEEVYAHLEEQPKGVRAKLEAGRDSAFLSRTLATIRTDVQITLSMDKARVSLHELGAVQQLFRELEFRTLVQRLQKLVGAAVPETPASKAAGQQLLLFGETMARIGTPPQYQVPQVTVVNTPEKLARLAGMLSQTRLIALDTETTSTDPLRADLVGISMALQEGEAFYIPVGHRTGDTQLSLAEVSAVLRPCLADARKKIVGHNLKYDALMLARHGMPCTSLAFDTMLAGWLVDPASRRLGLKDMAETWLDIAMTHIEELIGSGKNQRSMADVAVDDVAAYAAADAEVTLRLQPLLAEQMQNRNATKLFEEIEMPLLPVLMEMEQNGVALDVPLFHRMAGELSQRMIEIEKEVHQVCGRPFNINSTQQLSDILFNVLRLPTPRSSRRTASGHISTSADILEEMRGAHPVVDQVLEYRELAKLKSTYVDALPAQINPRTGRVHTSFNQTGSVTGRLASSEPNLQNIPTRSEIGRRVRQGFIAAPGQVLLSVDYSQIELRIVAHMSGDQAMLDAFRAGQDIHAATAAAIYNVALDGVSKEMRRHAKAINFGLIYGMSAFGLSRSADLTLSEAENFVKAYFQQFPGVKNYLDGLRRQAAQQGYVETMLGRRRYFPNLKNLANPNQRNREEREAINAPIQGTAADIMKIAMIRLHQTLAHESCGARLLLQVHDELVLECPLESLSQTAGLVRSVMEAAYPLAIPLLTEARSGVNWGSLEVMA